MIPSNHIRRLDHSLIGPGDDTKVSHLLTNMIPSSSFSQMQMTIKQRNSKKPNVSNDSTSSKKSSTLRSSIHRKKAGLLAMFLLFLITLSLTMGTIALQRKFFPNIKKRQIQIWVPHLLEKTKKFTIVALHNWTKSLQPLSDVSSSSNNNIIMIPHFVDEYKVGNTTIHQANHPKMDVCHILKNCFPEGDVYGTDKTCHPNVDLTLRYYDSAFMVKDAGTENQRIVGFMSIYRDYNQWINQHALISYNVCVAPDQRGKGIAKTMIPKFMDALIDHYKIRHLTDPKLILHPSGDKKADKPLLLGLDVDFTSETSVDAMVLYAKMGFIRWWTPCKSVSQFDWSSVYLSHLANNKNSSFALQQLIHDPASYIDSSYSPEKKFSHYCMYKFYADGWSQFGKFLKDYISGTMPVPRKQQIKKTVKN